MTSVGFANKTQVKSVPFPSECGQTCYEKLQVTAAAFAISASGRRRTLDDDEMMNLQTLKQNKLRNFEELLIIQLAQNRSTKKRIAIHGVALRHLAQQQKNAFASTIPRTLTVFVTVNSSFGASNETHVITVLIVCLRHSWTLCTLSDRVTN